MRSLVVRLLANAAALAAATALVDGVDLRSAALPDQVVALLVVAAIFGVVNAIVKPVVQLLALPFVVLTLGLLLFVINAAMLELTSAIAGALDVPFRVTGFIPALLGSLVITVVSVMLHVVLPDE